MKTTSAGIAVFAILLANAGCCPFSVTAISEVEVNKGKLCCHEEGIPFYLPKPLLVISKNFHYVEEATIGLTQPVPVPNTFDHQDTFATLNAQAGISTTSESPPKGGDGGGTPPATHTRAGAGADQKSTTDNCCSEQILHSTTGIPVAPSTDSKLVPATTPFFTYQIVFVPDLTQKHYLRIKGGPGEVRATMNIVNGWMFTGIGPFYLKDSSTAQNILATGVLAKFAGSGAADIINSVANLSKNLQAGGGKPSNDVRDFLNYAEHVYEMTQREVPAPGECVQAEIHVYEPHVTPDGDSEWREINCGHTDFAARCLAAAPRTACVPPPAVPVVTMQDIKDLRALEMRADAPATDILRLAAQGTFDPAHAQVDKAAVQALAPPIPQKRCGFFGRLFGHRRLVNGEVNGPTSVTTPPTGPVMPAMAPTPVMVPGSPMVPGCMALPAMPAMAPPAPVVAPPAAPATPPVQMPQAPPHP